MAVAIERKSQLPCFSFDLWRWRENEGEWRGMTECPGPSTVGKCLSLDGAHSLIGDGMGAMDNASGHGLNEMCSYHSYCMFVRVGDSGVTTVRLTGWLDSIPLAHDRSRPDLMGRSQAALSSKPPESRCPSSWHAYL